MPDALPPPPGVAHGVPLAPSGLRNRGNPWRPLLRPLELATGVALAVGSLSIIGASAATGWHPWGLAEFPAAVVVAHFFTAVSFLVAGFGQFAHYQVTGGKLSRVAACGFFSVTPLMLIFVVFSIGTTTCGCCPCPTRYSVDLSMLAVPTGIAGISITLRGLAWLKHPVELPRILMTSTLFHVSGGFLILGALLFALEIGLDGNVLSLVWAPLAVAAFFSVTSARRSRQRRSS